MAVLKNSFVFFLFYLAQGRCGTMNDTKTLLKNLLADYDINVRPVADQSKAVNVSIQAYIKSIQEFDEVQGKLSFVGALWVKWHDANMMWSPTLYGGVYQTTVLYSYVWIPQMILSSPAEEVGTLGKKWNKIRFFADGTALWLAVDLIESTCAVNVRNYPFDTQECVTSFTSFGYMEYEVKLHPMTDKFDFYVYQENTAWKIKDSKVTRSQTGGNSEVNLKLLLESKPSFVIINVLLPIIFLSLLNIVVFLLVPVSGERVSYAITVLLSIAVFMTIVSDLLPRSSEPVPLISYKLTTDMVISSLIVFVTVINLRWYNTDDEEPVPAWIQYVYRSLTCSRKKSSKVDPKSDNNVQAKSEKTDRNLSEVKTIQVQEYDPGKIESQLGRLVAEYEDKETITWRMISKFVDRVSLIFFTLASLGSFAFFIAVTAVS